MKKEEYFGRNNYEDIIDLPHPVSGTRPHMTMLERAAQFSPFAALTGYEDAVKETARLTDRRVELDEYEKAALDERLQFLQKKLTEMPEVSIIWFRPDEKKDGGAYVTSNGRLKKIEYHEQRIVLEDGTQIPLKEIVGIEGEVFKKLENDNENALDNLK